ncbi:MAG: FkbM family methyltransferase [Planctomycetota bacterium]|nr:FkbM family methyltransferase [Planctomycetota bacterium]
MSRLPFSLIEMLGELTPRVRIVDVGASNIGEEPPYEPLLAAGAGTLTGFEPDDAAREQLETSGRHAGKCRYLPNVVGDGAERDFHICELTMTSSLYPPNTPLLRLFNALEELTRVVQTERVKTTRLDDVAAIDAMDYLKIDVQGAELDVFRGAPRLLSGTVVVQTEVEFVPLYVGQPLFGDVDVHLRAQGFVLHSLLTPSGRTFKPIVLNSNPLDTLRQHLWADAIYVRDFTRFRERSPRELLIIATIMHECYGSVDLAAHALLHYDAQTPRTATHPYGLWNEYLRRLWGVLPTERPEV